MPYYRSSSVASEGDLYSYSTVLCKNKVGLGSPLRIWYGNLGNLVPGLSISALVPGFCETGALGTLDLQVMA